MRLEYSWDKVNCGVEVAANVKSTVSGIELSNVVVKYSVFYRHPANVVSSLLKSYLLPYSKIDTTTREGKRELKEDLLKRIEALNQEIKKLELGVKMCTKEKSYFKDEQTLQNRE